MLSAQRLFPRQCFIQHKLVTLCYSAGAGGSGKTESAKERKNECFMQNTSSVSHEDVYFRFLAPNPGNLGPEIFWSRSSQREPTIKSFMVSKVGWISLATRATNLKSLVKSVKSRGPRKNQEIRFGFKPGHLRPYKLHWNPLLPKHPNWRPSADPSIVCSLQQQPTKKPTVHPSNAPKSSPCAIPTATCPQLCQLVPNLVAHNLSETRTLKDRKWCFFTDKDMPMVNTTYAKNMIFFAPSAKQWSKQWCPPLIGRSWRVYLGSSSDFKLLGPLTQKDTLRLKDKHMRVEALHKRQTCCWKHPCHDFSSMHQWHYSYSNRFIRIIGVQQM